MEEDKELKNEIFRIKDDLDFERIALEVFRFQYLNNTVYQNYVNYLNVDAKEISHIQQIPFLPIEFFKHHKIMVNSFGEQLTFLSSGTTGSNQSKHYIVDKKLYQKSFVACFEQFYGEIENYCFLALLPGYLERKGSSLIYMVEQLIELSKHPDNGFYLSEFEQLASKIEKLEKTEQKYILIGVTYALLDFVEQFSLKLQNGIVMETGGMKGKRKELTKNELHETLKNRFKVENIHSEYGMTELLSQAYSKGGGLFSSPDWMRVLIRDTYDPFSYVEEGRTGGINVIDLANIYSCSFIETKDLGRKNKNGQFEVLGRFDNSDIRGCNLLVD